MLNLRLSEMGRVSYFCMELSFITSLTSLLSKGLMMDGVTHAKSRKCPVRWTVVFPSFGVHHLTLCSCYYHMLIHID